MRILFVLPYTPNAVRPRAIETLRALAERGHEISIATLWFTEEERSDLEALRAEGFAIFAKPLSRARRVWNRACAVASLRPTDARLCWVPDLTREIDPTGFDVLHFEHSRSAIFARQLGRRVPTVFDTVDAMSLLNRRALDHWGWRRVGLRLGWDALTYEEFDASLLHQFPFVTVTSPIDAEALLRLRRNARSEVTVIPNGVDLKRFRPPKVPARVPDELVMSGKMTYHPNIAMASQFVSKILPRIRLRRPEVRLRVVGEAPTRAVRCLGEHPGVTVVGRVDDLRPDLCRASLAVATVPYGAGIQNKVLEAMACATPVVASTQAASALSADDETLVVANEPEEIARRCCELLDDPARLGKLGIAGRRYVELEHRWSQLAERFEAVYERAITHHRRTDRDR
ncbi:MAG: glycosyltransferase [Deltaproteobacteria bacterium]|nr:glycosyltransferase [Deltaproteobacteria bacterium]